jgi:hypothetical protein
MKTKDNNISEKKLIVSAYPVDEKLCAICSKYKNELCPLIDTYQLITGKFPVAALSEIRHLFSHISTYCLSGNENELFLAENEHLKRAVLDMYKDLCHVLIDYYHNCREEYRHYDLSKLGNNGDFLKKVGTMFVKGENLFSDAKNSENAGNDSRATLFKKYEKAYNQLYKVRNEYLKHAPALRHAKFMGFLGNIGKTFGIALTVLTTIITILSFCGINMQDLMHMFFK